MTYLITGATGNIGSRVVDRMLARGRRPAIFVRDRQKAKARFGDRVDVVVGDLGDAASLARGFAGADVVFLINSGFGLELRDEAAGRVAKATGVKRIVKLSSADAEQQVGTGAWHARGEAAIRATGIACAFVRPTGFMDNALYWAHSIKAEGVVRSATGDGTIPFIHSDDIADVAVEMLLEPKYDGRAASITGPRALSYREMVEKIGAAIGRSLAYRELSDEEARRAQAAWGESPEMVDAHLSIYRAIREGRLAVVTDEVQCILGRPPLGFDRWIEQHASFFR